MENTIKQIQQAIDNFSGPGGRRYFQGAKRGENFELKAELNSEYKSTRKDAVKKVIANMTVGKDVSVLFADVVKNMQTEDLELKKLVYLYLTNYAKTQPELVILAVNTFVKDSDDPNPLIRALAIRTMGCLRVEKIKDYLCDPLKKALNDDHPYVRKTAALCVAKLHDLDEQLAYDNNFITMLQDMLSDGNPMVVSNVVAALVDIKESSTRPDIFQVNSTLLPKLLSALNDCTEWGQIFILEALASYTPTSTHEADDVIERVFARLQHANASVVLSATRILLVYMVHASENAYKLIQKKITPPLTTLLSSPPEIQYVALKNIDLIMQKYPTLLSHQIKAFFCEFNDPPYVKLAKLDIMLKLVNEASIDQLLSELKEYANEVDVDFVRKSIKAIGRCALKLEFAVEKVINVLLDLIKNRQNYVVQEAIIVMKDIFRKYPNTLDELEAKASIIWMIGEYSSKIENAEELIQYFFSNFETEHYSVQLQLLTATVKLFLTKPDKAQKLTQKILETATSSGESADLRDKAYIYWRLISADPSVAKSIVFSAKPRIDGYREGIDGSVLQPDEVLIDLINHLATIASVYQVPTVSFIKADTPVTDNIEDLWEM